MRAARICVCFLVWGGLCTTICGLHLRRRCASADAGRCQLATDASGNLYFANLNCVFELDRNSVLNRIAGNLLPGFSCHGGPALDAQIFLSANRR